MQSETLKIKFKEGFEKMMPDPAVRRILISALEIFSRKGLCAAKIKDLAAYAEFSQGFIYNYFKSKEEIFVRLSELAAEGALNSVQYCAELPGTAYEKIEALTEAFLSPDSIAMRHWKLIILQASAPEAIPEAAKLKCNEKMRETIEIMCGLISQGQKEGNIIDDDPLLLSISYFSFIQGLALSRIQNGDKIPFPNTEMILSFLRT